MEQSDKNSKIEPTSTGGPPPIDVNLTSPDLNSSSSEPSSSRLEILANSRKSSFSDNLWKKWEQTLEKIVPAVIAIRLNVVRSFDTEKSCSTQATGFVVDSRRGILLTNRHVINPGPITAEAIFYDREEAAIRPIYRDPIHDFGFAQFDPSTIKYMKLVEIPLRPDLARVGLEIRVVGNDAGEKLSILAGTLARLDRSAPQYGTGKYNDFDTFYYQAASGTSGGSSGSPIIDINGNAIALNAGGKKKAASSYYLPLDRILRALCLIQKAQKVSRGTIQASFKHLAYDEARRLGLQRETEEIIREAFRTETGVLVVDQVLPNGPSYGYLESGDIIIKLNQNFLTHFVPLEAILDDYVGRTIAIEIQRGGITMIFDIEVQDLHEITPNKFLEISGGVINELSYQVAHSYCIPTSGVFVASSGYMFGLAGISSGSLILSIDNQPTPTLESFKTVIKEIPQGKRVPVRYVALTDPHRQRVSLLAMDHCWHPLRFAVRNDDSGIWNYIDIPVTSRKFAIEPASTSYSSVSNKSFPFLDQIQKSLVQVEYHVPFSIDGVHSNNLIGVGLIINKAKGLIVTDRNTVPISLGDVYITFAGSIMIPGRAIYLHPYHNFAIIQYDPTNIGTTVTEQAVLDESRLNVGDETFMIGLAKSHHLVYKSTTVLSRRGVTVRECNPARFRATNLEVVEVSNPLSCLGANAEGDDSQFYAGIDVDLLSPVVTPLELGKEPKLRSLFVEYLEVPISEVRALGLSQTWLSELENTISQRRYATAVRRCFAGSDASHYLKEGDLVLQANGKLVTTIRDLDLDMNNEFVQLKILRDGQELDFRVATMPVYGLGTTRVIGWSGALLQEPHMAVSMQRKEMPPGVYSSWWSNGSPAHMYGLRAMVWITEINGIKIHDLDSFLKAVAKFPSETYVRIKTIDFSNRVSVIALKTDYHYWPSWELRLDITSDSPLGGEWKRTFCHHTF